MALLPHPIATAVSVESLKNLPKDDFLKLRPVEVNY
jgi:hypothetical protein